MTVSNETNRMMTVNIADIKIPEGRVFNEKNVNRIMESIQEVGMMTPIIITESTGQLIIGMHRLEAMKRLGKTQIQAIITEETEPAKLKIMEITENMARNEKFSVPEMCKMAWEIKQAWIDQGLFNEGHKQKEGENKLRVEDIANITKVSKSTIKNHVRVWENLADELKEYVMDNREKFKLTDLLELVKLPKDEQPENIKDYTAESRKEAKKKEGTTAENFEEIYKEKVKEGLEEIKKLKQENADLKKQLQQAKVKTVDKKKIVRLIHPDKFSSSLKDKPELLKNLNDATAYVNSL